MGAKLDLWPFYLVAAALLVRILYFVQYAGSPLMGYFPADQYYYLTWARQIASGNWLAAAVFEQGPLYPYLLGTGFRLLGEHVPAALLLQMLLGAFLPWLVYDASRRLFGKPTAILAGLATALYGPIVYYECMIMKEFLSPLLTMGALVAGLRYAEARRPAWVGLAGAAVGLACLIRENHVLLLVPLAVWIVLSHAADAALPRITFKQRLTHMSCLLLVALVCIVPATLHNWVVGRELVAVTAGGGEVFYIAHGPAAKGFYFPPDFVIAAPYQEHEDFRREAQRRTGRTMTRGESSQFWFREGLREMLAQPGRELKLIAIKAAILLNDYDVPDSGSFAAARQFVPMLRVLPTFGWTAGVGIVGVLLSLTQWRRCFLPLGFVAVHAASILLIYNFGRFRVGMMPVWIMLAAMAAVTIVEGLQASGRRRVQSLLAAVLAAGLTAAAFYPLHAGTFEFADAQQVANLAMRHKDYELAERELRRVREALQSTPQFMGSAEYQSMVATTGEMLADVFCRTGRYVDAVEQFGRNRQVVLRNDLREKRLLYEVALLQGVLRTRQPDVPRAEVSAEISQAAQELCALKPHEVSYWGVRSMHLESAAAAEQVAEGLQRAWSGLDKPSVSEQGWHQLGQAFLARFGGDRQESIAAARTALSVWPEHPYRHELDELLQASE